jgi:hypothetical protein
VNLPCPFCTEAPEPMPATVLAPQGRYGDAFELFQWVPACDDHWSTWWFGGDFDHEPEKRPPAFLLSTMQPIPVEDHPICADWLEDRELYSEKNRYRHPWLNVKPEDAVPGIIVKTILPPRE